MCRSNSSGPTKTLAGGCASRNQNLRSRAGYLFELLAVIASRRSRLLREFFFPQRGSIQNRLRDVSFLQSLKQASPVSLTLVPDRSLYDCTMSILKQQLPGQAKLVRSLCFSPEGKYLASAGESGTRLWDTWCRSINHW